MGAVAMSIAGVSDSPQVQRLPSQAPANATEEGPLMRRGRPVAFLDGTMRVGTEVQPGTYRALGPFRNCYWARLSGFGGQTDEIIANDDEPGAIVRIGPSDVAFQSRGCGTWTADLSAITSSPDSAFGDGTFIVGIDIAAGTWRSDSPETCYWARLAGFSGGMGDVIANENGVGFVTIARTDKGFQSSSCGTWTKIAGQPGSRADRGRLQQSEDYSIWRPAASERWRKEYCARRLGYSDYADLNARAPSRIAANVLLCLSNGNPF